MITRLTKQEILAKVRHGATIIFTPGYPNPWIEKVGEVRQDIDNHMLLELICEGWLKFIGQSHPSETLYIFGSNNGPVTFQPEKISFSRLTSLESVV